LITATGTAANPIVFQKSGSGINPLITAGVGTTTTNDGIIVIAGGDYITFDGIDLQESAANLDATSQMEWGYALVKASATAPFNGCQYITIKNCTITLNKANTASKGIYSGNHISTSITALTITDPSDAMSNCKFFSNTVTNSYMGIYLLGFAAASPYTLYDQNNEVGVSGGNTVTNFGGGSVAVYGISVGYQNAVKVNNNTVNGGAGTTTTLYGILLGSASSAAVDIVGNTVTVTSAATSSSLAGIYNSMGSSTVSSVLTIANNTVQNSSYPTATTGGFYGIINTVSQGTVNFYGNTVANNTRIGTGSFYCTQSYTATNTYYYSNSIHDNSNTGVAGGSIYGYYNSGSPVTETYHDNTIYNLTHSGTGSVYGMYILTTAGQKDSYQNEIHGLSSGGSVYGFYSTYGSPHNFYKNQIYDLSTTSTSTGVIYGAYLGATTSNLYNNYIYNLRAPTATGINAINGIYISGGTNANVYYNTVYLNATSTSATTFGSSGLYASSTPILEVRDNIIVNTNAYVGTAYTVAYRRSSTTLTTYAAASNNNDFYAGTPGANNLIYYDGTNADQTIGDFKTRVASRDGSSISEFPHFVLVSGNPCRINTTIGTQLESGGTPVTTPVAITDDFFANVRNVATPDIGAEEFNGILVDLSPPSILYTALGNTNLTAARTLTATITDPSGVPTSGPGLPVLYWKKNSGSYSSVTGTSIGSDQYTFTFGSGVATNDTVKYYIVAQDNASTPNVGSFPSTGAGGFTINPPAASIPPTVPSSYLITAGPLAGDYTVGATLFNQLTGKNITFEKLIKKVMMEVPVLQENTSVKNGVVSANLVENASGKTKLVEVDQVSWIPMENGKVYDGQLYIKKSENPGYDYPSGVNGVYATITAAVGDLNLRGVTGPTRFLLNDASYSTGETFPVTIAISSAYLPTATNTVTIKPNTGVTTTITGTATSTALFKLNGADYITIDGSNSSGGTSRDLTLTSLTPSTITAVAVWIASASVTDGAMYDVIKNCNFIGTGGATPTIGGIISGSGTTMGNAADAPNSYNTIQNNSFIAFQNGVYHSGFASTPFDQNLTITGNSFGSDVAVNQLIFRGLILQNVQNFSITGNTISGVVSTATSTSTMTGIQIGSSVVGGTINKNIINNIKQTNPGGYAAAGIYLGATTTTSGLSIFNNFIYNVSSAGDAYRTNYNGYGFWLATGGGYNLYYNSVRSSTNQTAVGGFPACLLIGSGITTVGSIDSYYHTFIIKSSFKDKNIFDVVC